MLIRNGVLKVVFRLEHPRCGTLSVILVLCKSLGFIHSFKKCLLSGYWAADHDTMRELNKADALVGKRQTIQLGSMLKLVSIQCLKNRTGWGDKSAIGKGELLFRWGEKRKYLKEVKE